MQIPARKPWWRRKKFWGMIIGCLSGFFGERVGLDPELARSVAMSAGTYVAYETGLDLTESLRGGAHTLRVIKDKAEKFLP